MFLQKLLDAHEEQNVDSYTEAVSGPSQTCSAKNFNLFNSGLGP